MIFLGYNYNNDEIKWKKIYWKNGEETQYSISNIGLVRNDVTNKILKTNFSKGYERLNLTHKGESKQYFIHRLVATAFIPNPENKKEVNHINGIKSCNYVYNLEWATRSENEIHAFKTGLKIGYKDSSSRLNDDTVKEICKLLEENELNQTEIANKVGCSRQSVISILNHKSHKDISKLYNIDNYTVKTDFSKKGDENESTKYSDKDIIKVCELIDEGKHSLREISEIMNIPYQAIRNVYYGTCRKDISKNYNFSKSSKRPLYEKRREMIVKVCELLDTGLNTKEVAEKLNVPRHIVRSVFSGASWREISENYNFSKKFK